jgi:hypothetical protein
MGSTTSKEDTQSKAEEPAPAVEQDDDDEPDEW